MLSRFHLIPERYGWTDGQICYINITCDKNKTSIILEFYFRFRFWPYHHSRHVILHQSAKFHPNWTARGRKVTSCRFSRWQISAILNFMGPIMGSLKSPCRTSYRSSIETIAVNCLVFEKITFLCKHFSDRQMDGQTDKEMDTAPAH